LVTKKRILIGKSDDTTQNCIDFPQDAIPLTQIDDIFLHNNYGFEESSDSSENSHRFFRKHGRMEEIDTDTDDLKKDARIRMSSEKLSIPTSGTSIHQHLHFSAMHSTPRSKLPSWSAPFINTIEIRTDVDGYNSGRSYLFRASSEMACARFGRVLHRTVAQLRRKQETHTRMQSLHEHFCTDSKSGTSRRFCAALIIKVPERAKLLLFSSFLQQECYSSRQ
jgi:hypothetical protein